MMKTLKATNSEKLILIDDEDFDSLSKFNWFISNNYAYRTSNLRPRLISRILLKLNKESGKVAEHKNKNTLDNRKENLEIFTYSQNNQNRAKTKSKTSSIYKGVFKDKRRPNKWRASIMKGNKTFYLGSFDIEIEAARAYNEAAIKYFTNPLLNVL